MAIIRARVSKADKKFIDDYLKATNISLSQLVRDSVIATIEDEIDENIYDQAMKEYEENPNDIIPFEDYVKGLLNE